MQERPPLQSLSDDELLHRLSKLTQQSRRVESELVAHIAETDERRLYAREASSSMFAYCTNVLHLSEAEAYLRIRAARASRQHPQLLSMLADGRLHLCGIGRLAPYLKGENAEALLERAVHKSKRHIEELIAELFPQPDAPAVMRKLPGRREQAPLGAGLSLGRGERASSVGPVSIDELRPDAVAMPGPETALDRAALNGERAGREECVGPVTGTARDAAALHLQRPGGVDGSPTFGATSAVLPAKVLPLAPGRYKIQFTAGAAFHDKLERLRALMRTRVPDGDLAAILEEAVTEKLERLEARRFATTKAPKKGLSQTDPTPSSRHIPAAVRRAVTARDGNRCRYVDTQGRRCTERHRLEFHHRHPFGLGGNHDPRNVCLLCPSHNQYVAVHDYGSGIMERSRGREPRFARAEPTRQPGSDHNPNLWEPVCGPGPEKPG